MSKRASWFVLAALCWAFVVVATYYVAHKPFAAAQLSALLAAARGWGGATLVVALGSGLGLPLLRRQELEPLERLVWATALGLGVVALGGLGLGAVGLLKPPLLWALVVIGLAVTGRRLGRAVRAAWADAAWRPAGGWERFLALYCRAMLVVAAVGASAPPAAWDGLVYHLTGPRLYLEHGALVHPFDLPYLGFPPLVELLFTWGMGMAGERAAAPIHWFYGLLSTLALVSAGRRWMDRSAGWLAAAILLSAPTVVLLAAWPYIDLALLLYTTLAFLALLRSGQSGWSPVLSGIFAGLALSTKYTALSLLPALAAAVCLLQIADRGWTATFRHPRPVIGDLLRVCGAAAITWLPALLKNLLLTGNPTYPFFFGGIYWDDWRAWWYDRPGTGLAATAPWRLLVAPWEATVWGVEGGMGYSAAIGPLFLALLPLLPIAWRRLSPAQRRWIAAALAVCTVAYGFWLWGVARSALLAQTRLLLPIFGLLALAIGAGATQAARSFRRPVHAGWLVRAVIALVLVLNGVDAGVQWARTTPARVLLGFESRDDYLAGRLGWYYPVIQAVNELPAGAQVLFLWEPRSYHCRAACLPDALLDRWLHATQLYGRDAAAIADAWRADGVTHVLLHQMGYQAVVDAAFDPVTPSDQAALAALQQTELRWVHDFGGAYFLYELEDSSRQ
ncbi:MAG: glycosyltransferase family 39 protein [Anaerolineae bacterium]|nr:glycosyltransferase family 39 protein [Anaerolineae bacterium]